MMTPMLMRIIVVVVALLVVAAPARADCLTGSSNEDGEDSGSHNRG